MYLLISNGALLVLDFCYSRMKEEVDGIRALVKRRIDTDKAFRKRVQKTGRQLLLVASPEEAIQVPSTYALPDTS